MNQSPATGGNRKLLAIIAFGIVGLVVGAMVRQMLYQAGDPANFDGAPPPRQGLNAPFVTTPDPVLEKMLAAAQLSADDLVYDLGCGDGRIVIAAALQSGCRGIGFDIDPERVNEARENVKSSGVQDRVTIEERDIFTLDLSGADVAMMYLLPWIMNELLPQFEQMKPGARIVSHNYWIDGVEPDAFYEIPIGDNLSPHGVYLYTVPLRKNPSLERGKPPRPAG